MVICLRPTDYYYVDGLLRYEKKDGDYELFYRYDQNGTLVSIVRNRFSDGATHKLYAVTNTRGDVIELRNGNGTINTKYTYDSWGKLISVTNASGVQLGVNTMGMQNSVLYRGYVYDRETGLYYLQSRYYDPETGRFLNADDVDYIGINSTSIGYNAFAYCENNAVNNIDISGKASKKNITKYYIWVYTYDKPDELDLGHIDFSIDGVVYSYGTRSADNNSLKNKLKGIVPGYIKVSQFKNWKKKQENDGYTIQDKVKIKLTKDEYLILKSYLCSFLILNTKSISNSSAKTRYYKVTRGNYAYYSFIKANCSTFVRDALYACMPNYVKLVSCRISINGYKGLWMPDNVFALAEGVALLK